MVINRQTELSSNDTERRALSLWQMSYLLWLVTVSRKHYVVGLQPGVLLNYKTCHYRAASVHRLSGRISISVIVNVLKGKKRTLLLYAIHGYSSLGLLRVIGLSMLLVICQLFRCALFFFLFFLMYLVYDFRYYTVTIKSLPFYFFVITFPTVNQFK